MSITANSLYRDTGRFLRHELISVLLIALLSSLITVVLNQALAPAAGQLTVFNDDHINNGLSLSEVLHHISPEQQKLLLRTAVVSAFAALTGDTLLLGGMLCLLLLASEGQRVSALRAIGTAAPLLPRLLLLTFLMTLLIQLGFMLFILPGIVLGILFSLSPIILISEKTGAIAAMRGSFGLVLSHFKLITPAVLLWLLAKMALLSLASLLSTLPGSVSALLVNGIKYFVLAVLVIYLFRLYMLVRSPTARG
jgi:hypothetical protein